MTYLSEASLLAGRLEEATQHAHRALELSQAHKEGGHQAWALWLLGEIAMHRDAPEVALAEEYYSQALILACKLGMQPLQAHCYRGRGIVYAKAGRREEALTELSTAIALYRTMDMTCWLPQAEAALPQGEER